MTDDLINIHIYDVLSIDRYVAMNAAELFAMQFPNRVGARNGVIYKSSLYVYRTPKGRIIVRGVYND